MPQPTFSSKTSFRVALIAAVALMTGCAASPPPAAQTTMSSQSPGSTDCAGVRVVVEFGILNGEGGTSCILVSDASSPAAEIVKAAGFNTEGTGTYGDQIVCRVNGLPSADEPFSVKGHDSYIESCADMPAGFAYWALWQKVSPGSEWAYATEGLATLSLAPGESLGLVFTTGDATPAPGS